MKPFWIKLSENTPDHNSEVLVKIDNGTCSGDVGFSHYDSETGFTPANCHSSNGGDVVFDGDVVAYAIVGR